MSAQAERAAKLAELFKAAVDAGEANWPLYLDLAVDGDMRADLESLLQQHGRGDGFWETPALSHTAESFIEESSRVGHIVGQYELLALIGSGGMGDVYLARDSKLSRKVALKIIRRGMDSADVIRRFEREERLLAGLNHPNIAQLYGGGVTNDGVSYFALEYVTGTRIDQHCKGLDLRERLELFCKVCRAVTYAHQHLVVHRDLKPSNILVTAEGEPKLLDFGIAKLLDNTSDAGFRTLTLTPILTPEYASPEHVRGETITTASDVYSLGVLLYELLTGVRPYRIETRTAVEIARVIAEHEVARPSTAVARGRKSGIGSQQSIRGDLDNIVLTAMRKEPERRYSSAGQFAADIRRYLEGRPVSARKDTFSYRAGKFLRRNRVAIGAAAVVTLAIIGGLIAALWQAQEARRERDLAQRQSVVAQEERLKAERINSFLQRMLSFSNQSVTSVSPVAQKKNVSVNEMLDQITPQVETELRDQPEVQAQVLRTIGSAYASQGRYDAAEKNLRAALNLQIRGGEKGELAAAQTELGVLLYREEKFPEAMKVLGSAVAFYRDARSRKSSDYNPARFVYALDSLGDVKANAGAMESALLLIKEAFEIASAPDFPIQDRALATYAKGDLGGVLIFKGKIDEGERLLHETVDEYRALSTQPRWELGAFLMVLGFAEEQKKRLDEAERYLAEGEQILRATLGDSAYLSNDLNQQAVVRFRRQDLPGAEAKAREAILVYQHIPSANPSGVANPETTLADILVAEGRFSEAEQYYRHLVELYEMAQPRSYFAMVSGKIRLSQCLVAQGRLAEAEKVAQGADADAWQHLADKQAVRQMTAANLAQILEKEAKQK